MTAPRLKLAERAAQEAARGSGQTDFPICPFRIAEEAGIEVVRKPPGIEGVSGGIIFGNSPVIFHSTAIRSRPFQRFTVAHELGHYFVEGHWDRLERTGAHVSRAGFGRARDPLETEADHFAACLLMPGHLVRRLLSRQPAGLSAVRALSLDAETSLTASAIRVAHCSDEPFAMVMSQNGVISYAFMSETFRRLRPARRLQKGAPLPEGASRRFSLDPRRVAARDEICVQTRMENWFGNGDHDLDEETVGLGSYGRTLTILSREAAPGIEDEADGEEDRLADSWTLRHAYGR